MDCVIALDRLEPLHAPDGRNVPGPLFINFIILRTTKNTLKTSHAPDLVTPLHTFYLLYLHILKQESFGPAQVCPKDESIMRS